MVIEKKTLLYLISKIESIKIPFYQREYQWTINNCLEFLNDIFTSKTQEYYIGQIIRKKNHKDDIIIDGQQRITTYILLLKSLENIKYYQYKNDFSSILHSFNFETMNVVDKDILIKIIRGQDLQQNEKASHYWENYEAMTKWIQDTITISNIDAFEQAVANVIVADVVIDDKTDEFDTFSKINSTGIPLSCYDLIKNFLFKEIAEAVESKILPLPLHNYLEIFHANLKFLKDDKEKKKFFRYFIAFQTTVLVNSTDKAIYEGFKKYCQEETEKFDSYQYEEIFYDIMDFAAFYRYIKSQLWTDDNTKIKIPLENIWSHVDTYLVLIIRILSVNATITKKALPYEIHFNDNQEKEIIKCLNIIESYKIRRFFCDYNDKNITRFMPKVKECLSYPMHVVLYARLYYNPNHSIKKQPTYKMPTNRELLSSMLTSDVYHKSDKDCKYFLYTIANRLTTKQYFARNKDNVLTIEHVWPQNDNKWNLAGYDANEVEIKKNTIGNLTLTVFNSEYQNETYDKKIEYMRNLKDSFILNSYFFNEHPNHWTIEDIDNRTKYLYEQTLKIFDPESFEEEFQCYYEQLEKDKIINLDENYDDEFMQDEYVLDCSASDSHSSSKVSSEDAIKKAYNTLKSYRNRFNIIWNEKMIIEGMNYCLVHKKSTEWVDEQIFKLTNTNGYGIWSIMQILGIETKRNRKKMNLEDFENLIKQHLTDIQLICAEVK